MAQAWLGDGRQFRVRRGWPCPLLTALPVESDRVRASLLGATNYIAKAMDLDEFAILLKISLRHFI